jgi:hypothetical protein
MSGTKLLVCRAAAIAAASASLAGCGGGDMSSGELASAAVSDVTVRTPLVDDDGYPVPPVPAARDMAQPATEHGPATR